MLFHYDEVDATYLDTAPVRGVVHQGLPVPAEVAFACLEDADAWPVWLTLVDRVRWHDEPPHGVGTTRSVWSLHLETVERFFAWEPGRRMSFRFERGLVPFQAFAEDWLVEPRGTTASELTWRYAFEARGPLSAVQGLFHRRFRREAITSARQLAEHLEANGDLYR